jgi:hypothetical protein
MRTPIALPPPLMECNSDMIGRRRLKQIQSIKERLMLFAKEARTRADALPPGLVKDELLRKARQADTASHLDDWVNSRGLQPPK